MTQDSDEKTLHFVLRMAHKAMVLNGWDKAHINDDTDKYSAYNAVHNTVNCVELLQTRAGDLIETSIDGNRVGFVTGDAGDNGLTPAEAMQFAANLTAAAKVILLFEEGDK